MLLGEKGDVCRKCTEINMQPGPPGRPGEAGKPGETGETPGHLDTTVTMVTQDRNHGDSWILLILWPSAHTLYEALGGRIVNMVRLSR